MSRPAAGGPVRFGFLGAGWIAGRALAPAVHAARGARLQAAAARDSARALALEPAGRAYDDYGALLDDESVEAVYLSLSNESHRPWATAALRAGKHVLCEKPLGLDAAEVEAMIETARTCDRLLVEAIWYRWHPRTRRLERLLAGGGLGAPTAVRAEFSFTGDPAQLAGNYRLDPDRGGGALHDVGCYAVSAAHLALGPGLQVTSAQIVAGPSGVDLTTTAQLRAPGGTGSGPSPTADVRAGMAGPDRQLLRVSGETATATFSAAEAFTVWRQPSSLQIVAAGGSVVLERFPAVDAYRLMVEAMARRIRGEDGFLVNLGHSLDVARTADAIRATATVI